MQKILFLCTGNYYRSRFSEHLFNHLASKHGLDWVADSRALAIERGINNPGPISRYAVAALAQRDIIIEDSDRYPLGANLEDFQTASKVIALDEYEHRPLMQERFPDLANSIEYWLVHDIDKTPADEALGNIEKQIVKLIKEELMANC
jgi:protein-tyrosine phosphatase